MTDSSKHLNEETPRFYGVAARAYSERQLQGTVCRDLAEVKGREKRFESSAFIGFCL